MLASSRAAIVVGESSPCVVHLVNHLTDGQMLESFTVMFLVGLAFPTANTLICTPWIDFSERLRPTVKGQPFPRWVPSVQHSYVMRTQQTCELSCECRDLKVTESSESVLAGTKRPPFRIVVRAVRPDGSRISTIRPAVSEEFVVSTSPHYPPPPPPISLYLWLLSWTLQR